MLHDQCPYLELESDGKGDDFRLVGVNTVTGGGDSLSESEDTTMTSLALWLSQAELVDGRLELLLQHDSCSCSADMAKWRDQPHPNCSIFRLIVLFLDNTVQSSPWSMFCSVPFYTGFVSYSVFVKNFEYLGPVVENLTYWGSKKTQKKRSRKLDTNSPFTLELRTVPEPFQAQCKRMQNCSKPIRFTWIGLTYKCRSRLIQNSYFL